jgi:hypothetical protein
MGASLDDRARTLSSHIYEDIVTDERFPSLAPLIAAEMLTPSDPPRDEFEFGLPGRDRVLISELSHLLLLNGVCRHETHLPSRRMQNSFETQATVDAGAAHRDADPQMSTAALVRRLDKLDHHERIAELVAFTQSRTERDREALQRELWAGDVHARRLALLVGAVRRDLEQAFTALSDPSLSVRSMAARAIGTRADTLPAAIVDRIDPVCLAVLMRQVVRRRSPALAQTLVEALCERQRLPEAAVLLSACTEAFIASRLSTIAWPETVWPRLARYRPVAMVAHVERAFAEDPERPDLVWRRYAPDVWRMLARHRPEVVADWVERFVDADALPPSLVDALPDLTRFDAARVVGWLEARPSWAERHPLPAGLPRRARMLDDAVLVPLCRILARGAPQTLAEMLRRLPHRRRATLFEAAVEPLELSHVEWPTALLVVLPETLRDREAARMLTLRRAQAHASWRRELLGHRSIEHARAPLQADGCGAQADDRAEAHAALVRSTVRSRRGMSETLAWLERIRNEQDPVRLAVLCALAETPGHQFTDRDALERVIAPIFDARDTSWGTRHAVATLAKRIMTAQATTPRSPMFAYAVDLLSRLAGQAGTIDLPLLYANLPRGGEHGIIAALVPWLEADRRRQLEHGTFRLWHALGKRAWNVPVLADLVERIMWKGHKSNAATAASLWIADPKHRDARVRKLVDRDRSSLHVHGVFAHCHRRRQTLLPDRFSPKPLRGRFHDGKVSVVPQVVSGFSRWTPALQRKYLELITKAEREPKHQAWTRATLVALRARIPLTTVADLQYAVDDADIVVQEAGLGALVWTDQPAAALPILLEHLDSDRARVAMYAVPRLARLMLRDTVVEALATVLGRPRLKVTVHKEVVRLLGQYATDRALRLLHECASTSVHRDVKIAILHAARSMLGREAAWALLTAAAADESPDVARAMVEVPVANIPQAHRAGYFDVITRVAEHADPTARAALFDALRNGWALASVRAAVEVATRVIARLDPLDPWRAAATVVADGSRSRAAHPAIEALVQALLDAARTDVAPAGERDQLPLQRLLAIVDQLAASRHPTTAILLDSLADRLLAEPLAWAAGVRGRIAAVDNALLGSTVAELVERSPSPRSCLSIEAAAAAAVADPMRDWSQVQALAVVDELAAGSVGMRLIATAILGPLGARWAWSTEWTNRLHRLREDSALDVRTAARGVWIAPA